MRTVHGYHVHTGKHLVKALPVGGLQFQLDFFMQLVAVVIMDAESEAARPARHPICS